MECALIRKGGEKKKRWPSQFILNFSAARDQIIGGKKQGKKVGERRWASSIAPLSPLPLSLQDQHTLILYCGIGKGEGERRGEK